MKTASVKGTRDFYPQDLQVRNWLFEQFRETSRLFGFQEIETPVVERDELYTQKSGLEIIDQMYVFERKKLNDDGQLVLRPEMTPSLARLVIQSGKNLIMPIRWYNIAQCWRYETCTTGRRREFFQWNMDIVGDPTINAEIELLFSIVEFMQRVGLSSNDVVIKISDRRLLTRLIKDRVEVDVNSILRVLDKRDKIDDPNKLLIDLGLDENESGAILSMPNELDDYKEYEEASNLLKIFEISELSEWLSFDLTVVRGLDYYTGVVFEVFDRRGKFRAICGGGRYDNLISSYDSKMDVSACGFGFGDCVIMEVLRDLKKIPQLKQRVDYLIVAFPELETVALQIAKSLRQKGCSVQCMLNAQKRLKWYYSYADREGVKEVILVAPEEYAEGKVQVKNLDTKLQQTQDIDRF